MNDQKVITLLQQTCKVLQGNYKTTAKCKEDIEALLNEIDEFLLEETGKRYIRRTTITETLATGIYGQ